MADGQKGTHPQTHLVDGQVAGVAEENGVGVVFAVATETNRAYRVVVIGQHRLVLGLQQTVFFEAVDDAFQHAFGDLAGTLLDAHLVDLPQPRIVLLILDRRAPGTAKTCVELLPGGGIGLGAGRTYISHHVVLDRVGNQRWIPRRKHAVLVVGSWLHKGLAGGAAEGSGAGWGEALLRLGSHG